MSAKEQPEVANASNLQEIPQDGEKSAETAQVEELEEKDDLESLDHLPIEEQIQRLEKELGIETELQRALEASLLIDRKFFDIAVISGNQNAERMFGNNAWADWLEGRVAAKEYGKRPLSLDFIKQLHTKLTKRTNPLISGVFRKLDLVGGDYKNLGQPASYSDEQLQAIKDNPLLSFTQIGDNPNTGLIEYPNSKKDTARFNLSEEAQKVYEQSGKTTQGLVDALITDLCSWYNSQRDQGNNDPYSIAAELQRRFISIHPFNDVNGRLSRLLMDWSLGEDEKCPSALYEPSNDILSLPDDWSSAVRAGSRSYERYEAVREKLEQIGYKSTQEMFGLSLMHSFYKQIYQHIKKAPKPVKEGEVMMHSEYETFEKDLSNEFEKFQAEYTALRPGDTWPLSQSYQQGGLISQSYIDLIGFSSKNAEKYQDYMRKHFSCEPIIYRGGISMQDITEQDVIRMFEHYVGIETGYKALQHAGISPVSLASVSPWAIKESLKEYNDLVSASYIGKQYPEVDLAQAFGRPIQQGDFGRIIRAHIEATKDMPQSPFVSTSLSEGTSENYTNPQTSVYVYGGKCGVLVEARATNQGGILAFGKNGFFGGEYDRSDIPGLNGIRFQYSSEEELMTPGGLHPFAVDTITVFYPAEGREVKKTLVAGRWAINNDIFLLIDRLDGDSSEQKEYKLNKQTGKYELVITPSARIKGSVNA